LFWAQAPFALLFGTGILLSIPRGTSAGPKGLGSTKAKLAALDYLGAITLVCSSVTTTGFTNNRSGILDITVLIRPFGD